MYLHRLPTEEDEQYHSKHMGADIFGQEKRGESEGFTKGAGTLERDNRTLYVNYEGAGSYDLPKVRAAAGLPADGRGLCELHAPPLQMSNPPPGGAAAFRSGSLGRWRGGALEGFHTWGFGAQGASVIDLFLLGGFPCPGDFGVWPWCARLITRAGCCMRSDPAARGGQLPDLGPDQAPLHGAPEDPGLRRV